MKRGPRRARYEWPASRRKSFHVRRSHRLPRRLIVGGKNPSLGARRNGGEARTADTAKNHAAYRRTAADEEYLRDCARQYSAELRFRVSSDPAGAIVAELERDPHAIAALTTHGRNAWVGGIMGSVACASCAKPNVP